MAFEDKYELVKETIKKYPEQVKQAWEEVRGINIDYKEIQNIVFCGMGGSALGARMIDSLFYDRLEVPLEIFNDYHVPIYTNDKTLVVISSYSGTTEESIAALEDAERRRAKIIVIATGGELAKLANEKNIPSYIFDPKQNVSKQPRMSTCYMSVSFLALLVSMKFVSMKDDEIYKTISQMQEAVKIYSDETNIENTAYNLSQKLKDKMPVLVASEHLFGTAYAVKNQFNENAKTFCTLFELPELNHHLMEGLAHPLVNKDLLHFVFINSHLYDPRIAKRYPLTQEVVAKNGIEHSMFTPTADDKISQVFETLIFGSFLVYYLTKSYNLDPMAIPWVDYFKEQLKK